MSKTIKDFLIEYANRFPEKVYNKEDFIQKTKGISFDYTDGVFDFYYPEEHFEYESDRTPIKRKIQITGFGGNNGYMLEDPDYEFVWSKLLEYESEFMNFLMEHGLGHNDLMILDVFWNDLDEEIGQQDVECDFFFYGK